MKQVAVLLLVVTIAMTGCKSAAKREKEKQAAQAKKDAQTTETNADVDFQSFIGRLRKAIRGRDMNTLAAMMTPDFGYVSGATGAEDREGEGVFQFWDENGLWPELEGIISEKFVKKGEYMVAPAQWANPALEYTGYRAGIRRVNGSWKFAYFVNG
ncbi:MAG TPA: hypothetical protein VGP40_01215 [Chthoniobacterales bacterium]|nr:hypothetical protein [Chthoniobacterales bacterium]